MSKSLMWALQEISEDGSRITVSTWETKEMSKQAKVNHAFDACERHGFKGNNLTIASANGFVWAAYGNKQLIEDLGYGPKNGYLYN